MRPLPSSPFRFLLVGAGRVGTAVSALLRSAGHTVSGVASRSPASVARAVDVLDAPRMDLDPVEWPDADVVLIGAGDGAIASIANAAAGWVGPGRVVVHFAGAMGVEPLRRAVDAGAVGCALHPVQACPDVDTAITRLPGSAWGVTCSLPVAEEWASGIIRSDLGGDPRIVAEDHRALWHAASVVTSNGIAALLSSSEALLDEIGVATPVDVVGPLAAGTVANARQGGGGGPTLTGPVVRGEVATIRGHLHAVAQRAPSLLDTYVTATRLILAAATRSGRLEPETATRIEAVLDGG
jgi:predicted short-subunit dehydrogenase-like oxidoreductase (DUF2520 family)